MTSYVSLLLGLVAATDPPGAKPAAPPGFAILAPHSWRATLEPFVRARASEFKVEAVAIEEILESETAGDAPERIKRWLHRGWKERGLRYVLLVGDADVLPVRYMVLDRAYEPACNYAFYPSDHYYADVADEKGEFDSWNASTEGFHARYFGEVHGESNKGDPINFDRISYVPELAVGRWPVSSTAALASVIAKTLAWQPTAPQPRALVVHASGWIDARGRAGAVVDRLAKGGFEVQRQFFGDAGKTPSPPTIANAVAGGLDLVLHVGHGTCDSWAGCFGMREADATRDAHPALYFSIGCNTAEFSSEAPYAPYVDESGILHRGNWQGEVFHAPPPPPASLQPGPLNTTGLGENLIRMPTGGAIVYIGCDTGAQPCGLTLLEGFTSSLADDPEETFGDAWRDALAHYWEAEHLATLKPDAGWYPPSIFFQGMKFLFFGDPTLRARVHG